MNTNWNTQTFMPTFLDYSVKNELSTEAITSYYTFDIVSDYEWMQKYFKSWTLPQVLGNTDILDARGQYGF